jgi:hypothetical protein
LGGGRRRATDTKRRRRRSLQPEPATSQSRPAAAPIAHRGLRYPLLVASPPRYLPQHRRVAAPLPQSPAGHGTSLRPRVTWSRVTRLPCLARDCCPTTPPQSGMVCGCQPCILHRACCAASLSAAAPTANPNPDPRALSNLFHFHHFHISYAHLKAWLQRIVAVMYSFLSACR